MKKLLPSVLPLALLTLPQPGGEAVALSRSETAFGALSELVIA